MLKEKEKLQKEVEELRKKEITYERSVRSSQKELKELEEKKAKEIADKTREVSTDLQTLDKDLKDRLRALNMNEENYVRRSDSLRIREMRVINLMEREKDLRKKALAIETRRVEGESFYSKASNIMARGEELRTRYGSGLEDIKRRETTIKKDTEYLNIEKDNMERLKKDYDASKISYEEIRKEIVPKLENIKMREKLLEERTAQLKQREEKVKGEAGENKRMLTHLSQKKEEMDRLEVKLKEQKIDIDIQALREGITIKE